MTEPQTTDWDLVMSIRGGHPEKCDFCEQLYGEDRYPVPEEAGEWACSECEARWRKADAERRSKTTEWRVRITDARGVAFDGCFSTEEDARFYALQYGGEAYLMDWGTKPAAEGQSPAPPPHAGTTATQQTSL